MLLTLLRLGQTERAEAALAGLDEHERASAEIRIALAALRLTQHDPQAATTALAPILDGSVPAFNAAWMVAAVLLEAIARDALGDPAAAGRTLERALDLAEPDRVLIPFLFYPAPGLLQRHARQRTAHAALIAEILSLLAGTSRRGRALCRAARRTAKPARAAHPGRDPRPALPAHQPVHAGDRRPAAACR